MYNWRIGPEIDPFETLYSIFNDFINYYNIDNTLQLLIINYY